MFASVVLEHFKINLAIPLEWLLQVDINQLVYNGINLSEKFVIFYSENHEEENVQPNFQLPVQTTRFKPVGCYIGRILKVFGKLFIKISF